MSAVSPRGPVSRMSLRGRVVAITLLLVVAALLAGNAVLVTLLQRQLVHQLDDRLRAAAATAARLSNPQDVPGATAPELREAVERDLAGDVYVVYLDSQGHLRRTLRPATHGAPRLPVLDTAAVAVREQRPFPVAAGGDGDEWRVIASPLAPGQDGEAGKGGSVVVAGSLAPVHTTIRRLGVGMLVIDAVVLVGLGVVAWFAVRAGLRPLRRIEKTAAAIAGGDLSSRVPQPATLRTELGRLSAALNGMLDRIEDGDAARAATNARMRTFIADASHELRTPLFGIKGFTELYRMGGMPERADVDAAMSRIEREAARLVRIVEELLLLARLDEDATADAQLTLRLTPMDLRTLAADALHDLRAMAPDRPVTLTGPGGGSPGGAPVLGDESRLRQVTSNLVGNAVAHTPPGTPVRIGVGTLGDQAVLELSDGGPGMTADQVTHVFDRFYRADTARGRTQTGGAGLGLSIVRSLVSAHQGRVEVCSAPGEGTTFRVLLPLHPDSSVGDS
ncbi:sensor histidine kinase [Streptomyces sp. YU58]|uniref:sensor histidine kinase n=1 Tax=Streptomyces sp. SX92 TaxID=3158972 RepID=UPI0027B914E5|nr:HAMP domain-containing sensor histidine kinase [Streptomyces coralus]WLW50340.1 HAMP domain-containing sensor histidine kinase [Streptomyces coralus]